MEKKLSCLLQILSENCDCGRYKVFTSADFLECLDCEENRDEIANELTSLLIELSTRGYIAVKYADKGMYCICAKPLLKQYFLEQERSSQAEVERFFHEKQVQKRDFFSGFFGGLVGAFLAVSIAFIGYLIFR